VSGNWADSSYEKEGMEGQRPECEGGREEFECEESMMEQRGLLLEDSCGSPMMTLSGCVENCFLFLF
jgi:hypothetical protein